MPPEADRGLEWALDRYWDQVAEGRLGPVGEVGPAEVATVRQIHAFDDRPDPTAAFVRRLREDLMHSPAGALPTDAATRFPPNGRGAVPMLAATWPTSSVRSGRRPALRQLAVAAVLVLILVGGYAAIIHPRSESGGPPRLPAVADDPTPPVTDPGQDAPGTLLEVALPGDVVPSPFALDLARLAIGPGGRVTIAADRWRDYPGTEISYVLEGELTMRVEGRLRVVRAGGSWASPEEVSPGTEVVLRPGDAAIAPFESARELAAPEDAWVEFLYASVVTEGWDVTGVAPGLFVRPGNRYRTVIPDDLPPGPISLTLRRSTADADPPSPITIPSGHAEDGAIELAIPEWFHEGTPIASPETTYVLTVRAAGPGAGTPTAAEARIEPLFETTVPAEAVPTGGGADFLIWHATILPGDRVAIPAKLAACCPGHQLTHVLAGELAVRVDGPLQVARVASAGSPRPAEAIPPGTEVVLGPGDSAVHGLQLPAEFANPGATPVHFVAGGLFAGFVPRAPEGYLIDGTESVFPAPALPPGPVVVTLERATLAPGGILAPPPPGDLRVVTIGREAAELVRRDGAVRNVGREPAVVYVMTLHPIGGTPAL